MLGECGVMLPLLESDTCTGRCRRNFEVHRHHQRVVRCAGHARQKFESVHQHRRRRNTHGFTTDQTHTTPVVDGAIVDMTTNDAAVDVVRRQRTSVLRRPTRELAIPAGVFDVTGTIALRVSQQSFSTSRLSGGTYNFSRSPPAARSISTCAKATRPPRPPTTAKPVTRATPCAEPIASSAILYVLVVGEAATSTFSIDAR